MKKKIRALLTLIVCAAMLYTGLTTSTAVGVSAATPIKSTINMVSKRSVTVTKGNRYKMKAVINGKTVTTKGKWSSSNKKVAVVDKAGVITTLNAGNTIIKITYKSKSLTTNIKVKAACIHKWKVTKKATCETTGKQVCTVCLKSEDIPKAAHSCYTDSYEMVEGRGKSYRACTNYCAGCDTDMTDWTPEQVSIHRFNLNNLKCSGKSVYGTDGELRYPKYVKIKIMDEWCKICGYHKSETKTDLYECTGKGGQKLPAGVDLKTYWSYAYYCQTHGLETCPVYRA